MYETVKKDIIILFFIQLFAVYNENIELRSYRYVMIVHVYKNLQIQFKYHSIEFSHC